MGRPHVLCLLGCAVALTLLTPHPGDVSAAWSSPVGSDPSVSLAGGAAVLAWLLLAWLLLTAALTLGGSLRGAVGHLCRRALRRTAPAALRRAMALTLGVGIVVGTAGSASASTSLDWPLAPAVPAAAAPPAAVPPGPAPATTGSPAGPTPTSAAAAGGPPAQPGVASVVVAPGDTLWSLASEHLAPEAPAAAVAIAWPTWWAANREVVGPDPDVLHPGQVLRVPERTPPAPRGPEHGPARP